MNLFKMFFGNKSNLSNLAKKEGQIIITDSREMYVDRSDTVREKIGYSTDEIDFKLTDKQATTDSQLIKTSNPSGNVIQEIIDIGGRSGEGVTVNGKEGPTITLTTTDINEGTNLYYTETRANSNFNTKIKAAKIEDLADGDTVVRNNTQLILNGGNSSLT